MVQLRSILFSTLGLFTISSCKVVSWEFPYPVPEVTGPFSMHLEKACLPPKRGEKVGMAALSQPQPAQYPVPSSG